MTLQALAAGRTLHLFLFLCSHFSFSLGNQLLILPAGSTGSCGGGIQTELPSCISLISCPKSLAASHADTPVANICWATKCFHHQHPPAAWLQTSARRRAQGRGGIYSQKWAGSRDVTPFGGRHLDVSHLPDQVLSRSQFVSFTNSATQNSEPFHL